MSIKDWKFSTTDNGTFFWEAFSAAGELLGRSSQNFKSQNGAKYNADLLGRSGSFSKNLNWDFAQNESKEWEWKCNNTINKENVGASSKSFKEKAEAIRNSVLFGYKGDLVSLLKKDEIKNTTTSKIAPVVTAASTTSKATISDISNHNDYQNNNIEDDEASSWWKWLLLALLILGLLWWLLPMLTNKNTVTAPEVKPITINSLKAESPKFDLKNALSSNKFSTLNGLIEKANLMDPISKMSPFVLLAPTNDAFAKVPQDILAQLALPEKVGTLQEILKGHIIPGNIDFATLKEGDKVKDTNGFELPVTYQNNKLFINDVEIDQAKVEQKGNYKIYEIPSLIGKVSIDTSAQTSSVAIIEKLAEATIQSEYKEGAALYKLNQNGNFTLLLKAINAADLKSTLETNGPFTIFAPTDEALKTIEPALLDLLKPENKGKLVEFLKQHVVSGKNTFAEFKAGKTLLNLNNKSINIKVDEHNVGLVEGPGNKSTAPVEDIEASNGIVHILTDNPLYI
jgi:transforming growth factor-beta-induced protein